MCRINVETLEYLYLNRFNSDFTYFLRSTRISASYDLVTLFYYEHVVKTKHLVCLTYV